jgi:hypothetical protein
MSSQLITIDSNSSASAAVDIMLRNNIRHLLVVDKDNMETIMKLIVQGCSYSQPLRQSGNDGGNSSDNDGDNGYTCDYLAPFLCA